VIAPFQLAAASARLPAAKSGSSGAQAGPSARLCRCGVYYVEPIEGV
jgi:hypothetical protein